MEFAQSVLSTIVDGIATVGALLLAALVCLLIVRAMPYILRSGFAFGMVAGRIIGEVIALALRCLTALAGGLVRVAIVAGAILAGVRVGPQVWAAYGSDTPAFLPALMTVALPFGAVFSFDPPVGRTFGALVAWSVAVVAIGSVTDALSPVGRSILLVGVLTTITAYTQLTGESHEARQEQQCVSEVDQIRAGDLHSRALDRSGDGYDAGSDQDVCVGGDLRSRSGVSGVG